MEFVAMILGLIALGIIATTVVALTVTWIVRKIKEKKALGYVKKVMVTDIRELANSCDNTVTLDQLDELVDKGYTHIMADVNSTGEVVGEVEVIKDTNQTLDDEVEKLLGRKGMVVVEVK